VTDFRVALLELLRKYQGDAEVDVLREGIKFLAEALMELEVSEQIGAGRYERSATRKTYRNGYRDREWDTRVGTVTLKIPRLREGRATFQACLSPDAGQNGFFWRWYRRPIFWG